VLGNLNEILKPGQTKKWRYDPSLR